MKFGFVAVDSTVEKARLDLINSKSSTCSLPEWPAVGTCSGLAAR